MKTAEEILITAMAKVLKISFDEAKKGYDEDVKNDPEINFMIPIMKEYATEAIKADRERVAKKATARHEIIKLGDSASITANLKVARVDKESILNLPIELP